MSIIIKGMEMPERCGRCRFVRWSNLNQTAWCTLAQEACFENFSMDYKNRRADFCPLVEIPTPHGRLIDADELASKTFYGKTSAPYITYRTFMNAPTVIEAEGSET